MFYEAKMMNEKVSVFNFSVLTYEFGLFTLDINAEENKLL